MKTIIIKRQSHQGEIRLTLEFEYDKDLLVLIKSIEGAQWSSSMRYWHIPDKPEMVGRLLKLMKGKAWIDYTSLKEESRSKTPPAVTEFTTLPELSQSDAKKIEEFRQWMVHRRYSDSTIGTYTSMLGNLLRFIRPKESIDLVLEDIVRFVN